MSYNYSNAFICPKCGALNHGGFGTGGCGLCGYTGYIIQSSGDVTVTINSSGSNVVGTPIQEKQITITESQFDACCIDAEQEYRDANFKGNARDILKRKLGF